MRRVHSTCLRILTHSCAHLPQNSSIEYHWIYRFVVQDESIRLMDESCGYIEQVDDDSVFGFVSGRDVRANLTTARNKPRGRSMRQHGQRFSRRQTQRRDEFGLDRSIVTDDLFKKKSLLDEQDDEEDHSTMSVSAYAKSEKKEDFRSNSLFMKNNII